MLEIIKDSSTRKLLILAILVRIFIMPFFAHPDIKTYNFQASFLQQGVINIYDYLIVNRDKLPLKEEFVYFPLTYFLLGTYQAVVSPFTPGMHEWLSNAAIDSVGDKHIFRNLFVLKIPHLIFDILTGLLLVGMFDNLTKKKKVLTFWLFNPFSIILLYVYSNVDIFPMFTIVLSLYLATRKRFVLAAFALGIGGAFKAFPLLLLPFLIIQTEGIWKKILVFVVGLVTLGVFIVPFIRSAAFVQSALVSGLTTRMISFGVEIGFGEILMPSLVLLGGLFGFSVVNRGVNLWKLCFCALLFILISIHFHIHWLLWLIPFGALLYAEEELERVSLFIVFIVTAFLIPILYQDRFMSFGLLGVISPLYGLLPIPASVLAKIYPSAVLQGIMHSILFGLGLLLSMKVLSKK